MTLFLYSAFYCSQRKRIQKIGSQNGTLHTLREYKVSENADIEIYIWLKGRILCIGIVSFSYKIWSSPEGLKAKACHRPYAVDFE